MSPADANLRQRTLRSLFWQFLGVGGQRIVQLIGPMALTRLLPPADIGLFVVVLTGIGVVESLTVFVGDQTTISSQRAADRAYLDTVFTVRVLRGLVISALLCGLAWPLAWFFADPEVSARYWLPGLFLALAGNGVLDALQSPARAAHMKGLEFRRIVLGDFVAAVLGVGLTVTLAFAWGDVWAMLVGHLGSTALRSALSYASAPHRPAVCFDRAVLKELLHYNLGAAGTPFLLLMIFTAPTFVLGKVLNDKAALAVYEFAGRLAKLPEDIFLRVLAPVAIPAYAQLRGDPERLRRAWLRAVHAFVLAGAPLTMALAWCGNALPQVVFGPTYGAIGGLFALLSLHGGLAGLTAVVGPLFWAVGKPQLDRNAQFFRCLVAYGLGVPAALWGGVNGFALAMGCAMGTGLSLSVAFALRHLGLSVGAFLEVTRDGLGIGLLMLTAMLTADHLFAPAGALRVAVAAAIAGPVLCVLALRLLRSRGRPPSPPAGAPTPPAEQPLAPEPHP